MSMKLRWDDPKQFLSYAWRKVQRANFGEVLVSQPCAKRKLRLDRVLVILLLYIEATTPRALASFKPR